MYWDPTPTPTPGTSISSGKPRVKKGAPSLVTFHQHQDHISQDGQGCSQDQDREEEGTDGVYVLVFWLQEKGKAELGLNNTSASLLPSHPALCRGEGLSLWDGHKAYPGPASQFIPFAKEQAEQITVQDKA